MTHRQINRIGNAPHFPVKKPEPTDFTPAGISEKFQHLVRALPSIFFKSTVDRLDSDVNTSLKRIARSLRLDRCCLLQLSSDGATLIPTHRWSRPGSDPAPLVGGCPGTPWICMKVLRGEVVALSRLDDLPEDGARDREFLKRVGTKSYLSLPMEVDGQVTGSMILESLGREVEWFDDLIGDIRQVACVFAGALERKRRKLQLMDGDRFEALLADLSAVFSEVTGELTDHDINRALRLILAFFRVDQCGIIVNNPERDEGVLSFLQCGEKVSPVPLSVNFARLTPWSFGKTARRGDVLAISAVDDLPKEAVCDRENYHRTGICSCLMIPMPVAGTVRYTLMLVCNSHERQWPKALIPRLRLLSDTFANALVRREAEEKLRRFNEEIRELRDKLKMEAAGCFGSEIKLSGKYDQIAGQSEAILRVLELVEKVAQTDSTVLIQGETGTGKELVARAIHSQSRRKERVMVTVNCASLPASLVECELFGREKGAYTGALTRQAGRFEMADGSTIFLDEIGELSMELQAKLLRVLQEGSFERLGSPKKVQVDVRVIAATNRDLAEEVRKGNFREDLYYRLNVFPITVPPLRERPQDIPILVWAFVGEFAEKMGKRISQISKRDLDELQGYGWPGNVRELRNVIEHSMIISSGEILRIQLPARNSREADPAKLDQVESQHILDVLRRTGWRIKGKNGAAGILGLNPSTLYSRMHKLGIPLRAERDDMSS